jgi:hypothetical protein
MEIEVAIPSFDGAVWGQSNSNRMHNNTFTSTYIVIISTYIQPIPGSMDQCACGAAFPQQAMSLGCRQGAWSNKAAPTGQSLAGALGDHRQRLRVRTQQYGNDRLSQTAIETERERVTDSNVENDSKKHRRLRRSMPVVACCLSLVG